MPLGSRIAPHYLFSPNKNIKEIEILLYYNEIMISLNTNLREKGILEELGKEREKGWA